MTCAACGKDIHAYPCVCGHDPTPAQLKQVWLVQHCQTPGCESAIRVKIETPLAHPICRWCQHGTATYAARTWPDGLPDPKRPWPWLTDQERARRLRLPFWRDRLARQAPIYEAWLTTPPLSE